MRNWRALIGGLLMLAGVGALAQTGPRLAPLDPVREAANAPSPGAKAAAPAAGTVQLTAQDVNAWLDGFIPYALGSGDIPGGVVVVVKDGQILTQRGYGLANTAKRTKVDPERTLFRPGSISKLFTWTAVMQLVEQGKLDLDADVNRYLDFKIPPRGGKPVTLRNIMTHTAGFEEQVMDLIASDEKNYVPSEKIVKRWVPQRIYDPGTTPAYSNYATALAGYIVGRVSGQTFDNYIEQHIFAPAGMRYSSFRQPLPAKFKPLMADGYQPGVKDPYGFEFVGVAPAGSLASSGADMGRFMIAHLANRGTLLKPETRELMYRTANDPIPGLQKMSLGFYQSDINGRRVVSHGGDTVAFHSDLHLFPEDNVGIYVSFNSSGKEGAVQPLRNAIFEQFADRYFPASSPEPKAIDAKQARKNAEMLAGTWTTSRRSDSSFLKVTDLIGQLKVAVGKDGELVIPSFTGLNGQPRQWVAIGPMLWRDVDGSDTLGAKVVDGKAVRLSLGSIAPIIVWDRTPWYRDSSWLLPLLYLSLTVLLLSALFWPVRALVRRRYGSKLDLDRRSLLAYRASRIGATAILTVLVLWAVGITMMFTDLNLLSGAYAPALIFLQILTAIVVVGGTAAALWYAVSVWSRSGGWKQTWKARLWSALLVIASLTVLWVCLAFRLIGFATLY